MNVLRWLAELDSGFCSHFTLTLLHLCWQVAVVAVIVFLAARIRLSSQARYVTNIACLLLMAACPLATFLLVSSSQLQISVAESRAIVDPPQVEETPPPIDNEDSAKTTHAKRVDAPPPKVASRKMAQSPALFDARSEEAFTEAAQPHASATLATLAPLATAAYFIGASIMLLRLALGLWSVNRLQCLATVINEPWVLALVRSQARRVGLNMAPIVARCERIAVPVVVGILRPTILLPSSLLGGFTPDQLEAVLTHEFAHIRRFDLAVNLLQRVIESLLFFHPAMWYVSRRVSIEREHCCDDFVLSAGCERIRYADALIRMAELLPQRSEVAAKVGTLAATGRSPSQLRHRVMRVLGDNPQPRLQLTRLGAKVLLMLLVSALAAPAIVRSWTRNEDAVEETDKPDKGGLARDANGDPLPKGAVARLGRLHLRPGGAVHSVVFSPNGKMLASANNDGVQLWDANTGLLIRRLDGHKDWVQAVAFSPNGKLLVSGGNDWTARIWDVQTGKQLHLLRCHRFGHLGLVHEIQVAFTPDGRQVISGGHNGVIEIWDVSTGKKLKKLAPEAPPAEGRFRDSLRVSALAVSPDGETVAAGGFDQRIRLWGVSTGALIRAIDVESKWVRDLTFSPDGETLAWCGTSRDRKVKSEGIVLWTWRMNVRRRKFPGHGSGRTYGIAFSPDGKRIVSSGFGNTIKLWSVKSGKEVWTARGHTGTPWKVAFAPDGKTVASCAGDGSVRLWSAKTGKEHLPNPQGHWGQVLAASILPDGRSVLVASRDRRIRKLDLFSGKKLSSFAIKAKNIEAFAFSSEGRFAAVGYDHFVDLWDMKSGKRTWSRESYDMQKNRPTFASPRARHIAFSQDSKLVATTTVNSDIDNRDTIVRIWDALSGRLIAQINRRAVISAPPTFTADGAALTINEYTVGAGKMIKERGIRTFSTKTGKLIPATEPPKAYANAAVLSPDGKMRVTGTSRSLIQFWDNATNEFLFSLQGPRCGASMSLLAFSPDGARISAAARGKHGVIYVWEIQSGKLTHEFSHGAKSLSFTPDGKKLITGHEDGSLLVWDVATVQPESLAPRRITRQEFKRRWEQLGYGYDSSRGNQGNHDRTNALSIGGDQTVALLEEILFDTDLERSDEELIRRLCAPLSSKDRREREAAMREIIKYGDHAYLAVSRMGDEPASDDLRSGVEQMLRRSLNYRRNSHGVIDLLRQIGTHRALRVLERLTQGPADTLQQRNRKTMATYTLKEVKALKLRRPANPGDQNDVDHQP